MNVLLAYSLVVAFFNQVCGHGTMLVPLPRSAGPGDTMWFSQGCSIGCQCNENNENFFINLCQSGLQPTVTKPEYLTFNIYKNSTIIPGWDWTKNHPWRAPGTANPLDSCGLSGGSTKNNDAAGGFGNQTIVGVQGFNGTNLPQKVPSTIWAQGSIVQVIWRIDANHGGGYQYRLCPRGEALTEECFTKTPLKFHGDMQTLVFIDGRTLKTPATRVTEGVLPEGSMWTKNPIPTCDATSGGFNGEGCEKNGKPNPTFPPPRGCDETCWGYQPCFPGQFPYPCDQSPIKTKEIPMIMDELEIPSDLPIGEYVISFRWDCEHTQQIWNQCGDITIVARA